MHSAGLCLIMHNQLTLLGPHNPRAHPNSILSNPMRPPHGSRLSLLQPIHMQPQASLSSGCSLKVTLPMGRKGLKGDLPFKMTGN